MNTAMVLSVGLLVGFGVYLLLSRRIFPMILGLSLMTHAANLVVLAAGDRRQRAPIVVDGIDSALLADPLPQALVLTAIVISMAVTLYLLALFAAGARKLGSDRVLPAEESDEGREIEVVGAELAGEREEAMR